MTVVRLGCQTQASYYDLSIYDTDLKGLVYGEANSDLDVDLPRGEYYLFWRLIGDAGTTYTITFSGVESPAEPLAREIESGESAAADQKLFTVA